MNPIDAPSAPDPATGLPPRPHLSVVVPCYNEQESVEQLLLRLRAACLASVGPSFEIVLVDDGSRDATWAKILAASHAETGIVGVKLSRNHGHQLALSAGLTVARGERILIIDADLQDPPELLPQMLRLMDEGADVVFGQRTVRHGESATKRATAALFYRLLNRLTDVRIPVDTGDFRLMSRRALDVLNAMPEQHRFIRGMVSWIGFRQVALPYERHERFAGETKYPFSKMLRLAIDAVTSFSTRPLRVASFFGFGFGFLGLAGLGYTLGSWFSGHVVTGWTSATSIFLLMGSAQMFVLGIIGEYLGRLYMEAKRRPMFVIESVVREAPERQVTAARSTAACVR
ncbi:MAG TPA: glycosyltransferase family 2 protein [Steroidobacteraceae bacterium]|nr:glycosyltransferase family 2 protein [Steroidobacteraceae bacterium]